MIRAQMPIEWAELQHFNFIMNIFEEFNEENEGNEKKRISDAELIAHMV